jgi:hypothetical protein
MSTAPVMAELVTAIRALPEERHGEIREGDRVLQLRRTKKLIELRLKLLGKHDGPLLNETLEVPRDAACNATIPAAHQ